MLEPRLADWLREIRKEVFFCGWVSLIFRCFTGDFGENWMVEGGVLMVNSWWFCGGLMDV
jgi:hypothetical protein